MEDAPQLRFDRPVATSSVVDVGADRRRAPGATRHDLGTPTPRLDGHVDEPLQDPTADGLDPGHVGRVGRVTPSGRSGRQASASAASTSTWNWRP